MINFGVPAHYDGRFGFNEFATQLYRDGGVQFLFKFPNGHTASIIRTPYSMQSASGWYEGIIMRTDSMNTWDGFLSSAVPLPNEQQVTAYLQKVHDLPNVSQCEAEAYDEIY